MSVNINTHVADQQEPKESPQAEESDDDMDYEECPYSTQQELIEAISKRRQRRKETSYDFVFSMLELFNYLESEWSDEKQVAYTLRNMSSVYRQQFLNKKVKSMSDIVDKTLEIDQREMLIRVSYRDFFFESDVDGCSDDEDCDEPLDYELTNKFENQSADKTDKSVTYQLDGSTVESADKVLQHSVKVEKQETTLDNEKKPPIFDEQGSASTVPTNIAGNCKIEVENQSDDSSDEIPAPTFVEKGNISVKVENQAEPNAKPF